jgi:A/G-specific adenine glycosylase
LASFELQKNSLELLSRELGLWAQQFGRRFRWRDSGVDHYRLIVTELLLQRTRAETVAAFEVAFFDQFRCWSDIVSTPETEIVNALAPIGLQTRRASVLKRLANKMSQLSNVVPNSREDIEDLPGVGQYIANAIELLVLDRSRPLLDTNMARLLERFIRPRTLADIRHDPWLQASAQYLVEQGDPRTINWAVLDFAAAVCKPRVPACDMCPVSIDCTFFVSTPS